MKKSELKNIIKEILNEDNDLYSQMFPDNENYLKALSQTDNIILSIIDDSVKISANDAFDLVEDKISKDEFRASVQKLKNTGWIDINGNILSIKTDKLKKEGLRDNQPISDKTNPSIKATIRSKPFKSNWSVSDTDDNNDDELPQEPDRIKEDKDDGSTRTIGEIFKELSNIKNPTVNRLLVELAEVITKEFEIAMDSIADDGFPIHNTTKERIIDKFTDRNGL